MSKAPIPKALRFAVFERDGFRCRYCGRHAEDTVLHADHRTPESKGGQTSLDNLVTACVACNVGKASFSPIRHIPCQREQALVAVIFQRSMERFTDFDYRDGWDVIYNACMGELEPDYLVRVVLDAKTWAQARVDIWRFCGFPVDELDEMGDVI